MRNSSRVRMLAVLGLITMLSFVGCSKAIITSTISTTGTAKTSSTPSSLTSTQTGSYGELRIAVSTFGAELFDPILATGTETYNLVAPVFDYSVGAEAGAPASNGLVEKWELAPDGLSWTFNIRRGVKFHDGSGLTAKDIKFSLERYSLKEANRAYLRDNLDRIDVLNDYSVRVYTKTKQPYFLSFAGLATGDQGMAMPKDYIEKVGIENFRNRPIGTGPFQLIKWNRGDSAEYEAHATYWRGAPAFKKLTVALVPEETTRLALLKTGASDAIEVTMEGAVAVEAAGLRTAAMDTNQVMVMLHGVYEAGAAALPAANIKVRQALSLAINRDEIGKNYFYGKMLPAMPPYIRPNQPEIDIPYWKDYSAKLFRYDLAEAKRLLGEAGYANGFAITMYASASAPYTAALAEVVAGYWQKIGVKPDIIPVDYGAIRRALYAVPQPANMFGVAMPFAAQGSFVTPRSQIGFTWNRGVWNLLANAMPRVNPLYDAALSETDQAKRKELIAELIKIDVDSLTMLTLGAVPAVAGLGPRVDVDFPMPSFGIPMYADRFKPRKQ